MGIDIGATAISAALFDCQTLHLYPIRWTKTGTQRLPVIVALSPEPLNPTLDASQKESGQDQEVSTGLASTERPSASGRLITRFKHLLNIGIPYRDSQHAAWVPQIQWTDTQQISLHSVRQAIVTVLSHLQHAQVEASLSGISSEVDPTALCRRALSQLAGVVVGYPTGWSDAYCFNVREAILAAGLVSTPEQIFLMEDAIAALLAELPVSYRTEDALDAPILPARTNQGTVRWQGATLVLSAGATSTELLLADLTRNPLSYENLFLRSFAYAGEAIDQDIVSQFLLPLLQKSDRPELQALELPLLGDPDISVRDRLNRQFRSSALGRSLLETAQQLKLTLNEQDAASLSVDGQMQTIRRQDLHHRVITPYLQRLNRELNSLLSQSGISAEAVQQVVCTGGTALLPNVQNWLKQKLPNAVLVQNFHQNSDQKTTSDSRIACGLAMLPLYPRMLNVSRHQYSDFFLVHEILAALPHQSLTLRQITQILESRGINTQACQRKILSLLEGPLPLGLSLSQADISLLTPESVNQTEYTALVTARLFRKSENQSYSLDLKVHSLLQKYLQAILSDTFQTLAEPLSYNLPVSLTLARVISSPLRS